MAKKGKARRSVLAQLSPQDRETAVLEVIATIERHGGGIADAINTAEQVREFSHDLGIPYLSVSMAVHGWAEPQDVREWTATHGEAV